MKIRNFILFFIIPVFYLILFIEIPIDSPNSPDESQIIFFVNHFQKTGELNWKSSLNEELNTLYFRPRGSLEVAKNVYSSQVSPHIIIIYATSLLICPLKLLLFFFTLGNILFFYLISKEIFKKEKISVFSTVLFALFPPLVFYSLTMSDLIPSIFFLLAGIFFIIKFNSCQKFSFILLSLLFLGHIY